MRANVIEAAEQCGILSLATVAEPVPLDRYLGQREPQRLLVFCDEAADATNPLQALRDATASNGIDILIGPEGGFAEEERVAAAAAAENLAAFAGTEGAACRYRRGSSPCAGTGGARRLDRDSGQPGSARAVKADILPGLFIKRLGRCGSKPCSGHAKGLRRTRGARSRGFLRYVELLNDFFC